MSPRLLRAFARTTTGILTIVGTDDENFAPQLVKLASDLRIADRVRILPRTVIGPEKELLFAAARLFVLPSYSENFGNTVLEAMRRGVPVVVTPEVGAAEIVRESGAGLVVAGEPEPLSSASRLLIADLSLAQSMGDAGKRHAARFTWDHVAMQMEDLYKGLKHPFCSGLAITQKLDLKSKIQVFVWGTGGQKINRHGIACCPLRVHRALLAI